jgi:hypothetical protein
MGEGTIQLAQGVGLEIYVRLNTITSSTLVIVVGLGLGVGSQAASNKPHVVAMQCHPLPPAATNKVAAILSKGAEERNLCPAGEYPVRYGDGTALPDDDMSCVHVEPNDDRFAHWAPPPIPLDDPAEARSLLHYLKRVQPCPPGWEMLNVAPPATMPPNKVPPPGLGRSLLGQ